MLIKNQTGQIVSGLKMDRVPSIDSVNRFIILSFKKRNKKKEISIKENCEAKAMIKPFAKRGFIWADQMALPWSDTTKLPIGVAMVQVSQVPKWNRGIYADQEAWQWFGFDQAPKWFYGLKPIKRHDWFRRDQVPKWSGGSRLSRGIALVRTRPSPQVI